MEVPLGESDLALFMGQPLIPGQSLTWSNSTAAALPIKIDFVERGAVSFVVPPGGEFHVEIGPQPFRLTFGKPDANPFGRG